MRFPRSIGRHWMVLALDNAGGGGPVVVDSAPAAMKMSELMSEIIDTAAAAIGASSRSTVAVDNSRAVPVVATLSGGAVKLAAAAGLEELFAAKRF